jgi:Cu/Ag efflux protein CusF
MQRKTLLFVAAPIAALWLAGCEPLATEGGAATERGAMPAMPAMPAAQQPGAERPAEHMAAGTLNSVDSAAGTVNISHGPVASANWPGMTMTFKLADPNAATNLKPGQKVDFHFTIESGMSATVTQIAPAD